MFRVKECADLASDAFWSTFVYSRELGVELEITSVISKVLYFYDRPNSLVLVIESVLFANFNICGRFWGKLGEFGRTRPETIILEITSYVS